MSYALIGNAIFFIINTALFVYGMTRIIKLRNKIDNASNPTGRLVVCYDAKYDERPIVFMEFKQEPDRLTDGELMLFEVVLQTSAKQTDSVMDHTSID